MEQLVVLTKSIQSIVKEKKNEKRWEEYIKRNEPFEKKIEEAMAELFQEQMDEVLKQIGEEKGMDKENIKSIIERTDLLLKGGKGSGDSHETHGGKEEEKPKKDRSKIERFEGADPRLVPKGDAKNPRISVQNGNKIIVIKKTGDVFHQLIRGKDTIEVNDKGEKIAVAGKFKMADGSAFPKHMSDPKHPSYVYIPPAWREVYINKNPKAEYQGEGLALNGKYQPLYTKAHTEKSSVEKTK
jgi:hypothetical protein